MTDGIERYLTRLCEVWTQLGKSTSVQLGFFVVLVGLTLAVRGRRAWSLRATFGVLATVTLVHLNFMVMPFLKLLLAGAQGVYDGLGIPRLPVDFWAGVPTGIVAVVAVVAYDFANYWNHRLMHTPLLWPVHAIHHSDPDVSGMTTFRVHALEPVVMVCSHVVLLTWLGLPADALGPVGVFLILHNMYIHADLDWTHGPLELLVASPRFHRWHHADVPAHYGTNLANVIPLFDVAFGTYLVPGPCTAPLGAVGVPESNPLKLFLYPAVVWSQQLRGAVVAVVTGVGSALETSLEAAVRVAALVPVRVRR